MSDTRFFVPGTMLWQIHREMILLLAGGSALLMQLAHPKVAAGVADHSHFKDDPLRRLQRTMDTMWAIIFDERSHALSVLEQLKNVHRRVHGEIQPAEPLPAGTSYDALDEELLLWVFATLIDSGIKSYDLLVRRLSTSEKSRYYDESKALARLFEIPAALIPPSLADFNNYMERMVASSAIAVGPMARSLAQEIVYPRPWILKPGAPLHRLMTAGLLPDKLRQAYGLEWNGRREKMFWAFGKVIRFLLPCVPRVLRIVPNARAAEKKISLLRK